MRRAVAIVSADLRLIARDPILVLLTALPVLLPVGFRFALPALSTLLATRLAFDLAPWYDMIVAILMLLAPTLLGMVWAFLILDDRDAGVLEYLAVTPPGVTGSTALRLVPAALLSGVVGAATVPLVALGSATLEEPMRLGVAAVLAALEAPLVALAIATVARNTVEGLTWGKMLSLANLAPLAAFLVDHPLRHLAGIVPMYWPPLILALTTRPVVVFAGAAAWHLALLAVVWRAFRRRHR